MSIVKGKSAYLFLAGLALIVAGAVLYYFSERLEGWENVQRGRNLERAALFTFIPGVLVWLYMVINAFTGKK